MSARLPVLLLLLAALVSCQRADDAGARQAGAATSHVEPTDVVFVCQFGYGKSLVSSRHFERMAAERGIPVRVFARGVTPTDNVPEPLATALGKDGFEVRDYRPQAVNLEELTGAEYVVSFGNEVPESTGAARMDWGDVSALSENYPKARDEIVAHLYELLDEIEARRSKSE